MVPNSSYVQVDQSQGGEEDYDESVKVVIEVVRLGKMIGVSFGPQEDILVRKIAELESKDGVGSQAFSVTKAS